jgi:hypothetical protein
MYIYVIACSAVKGPMAYAGNVRVYELRGVNIAQCREAWNEFQGGKQYAGKGERCQGQVKMEV